MNIRNIALASILALVIPAGDAGAQQAQRVYRVGILNFGSAASAVASPIYQRISERLRELGFGEGANLVVEKRFADGNFERVAPLTRELVQAKVDVIITGGNRIVHLVTEANPRVPMVSLSCDSFTSVSNYARPNGNFTGVTCMSTELSPKRLELAKQLVPSASRMVYLHNPNQGGTGLELTQKAAASVGVTVSAVEMRSSKDVESALASVATQRPDVLLVYPDTITFIHRKEIADFALKHRLPAVFAYKEFAEAGGLISYGSTLQELGDRAAELAARILRGAKPHELPLQQATRVYFTVNLKTAREMGQTIPTSLLQRADYVIDDN